MTAPARLGQIRFNGGDVVDVGSADIVVLVGPNNSGKSRTLQEIWTLANLIPGAPFDRGQLYALDGLQVDRLVDADGFSEWLSQHRTPMIDQSNQRRSVRAIGSGDFFLDEMQTFWGQSEESFGRLAPQIFRLIGPGDGRNMLGSASRLEPRQIPDHAIQTLVRDAGRRRLFESAFRAAFRQNLIVDSWFSNTRLRLSPTEVQSDFEHTSADGLPSEALADRLARLPLLETQSDGVRTFGGLLLTLVTVRHPVLLLDEPETFLHPPQARLLGEYLGRLRGEGQLVIATHSLDILLGLLQQNSANVLVVRLSRDAGRTKALTIPPESVRSLWRDPLLRFSRALDGIFHEGVVICEGDTDSQFYSAVSYHLSTTREQEAGPIAEAETAPSFSANPFDVMFAYAGGKQRIKMIAAALVAVHVPVRVIVDFDILNDKGNLQRLVESLGHEYTEEIESLRRLVDSGLRGSTSAPTLGKVRPAVLQALAGDDNIPLTPSIAAAIQTAIESPTGWSAAKRQGRAAVPSGDASKALDTLLDSLKDVGVHVVPIGAVESWVKAVGHHGAAWVVEVIEQDLIGASVEAQAFVSSVLDDLSGGQV